MLVIGEQAYIRLGGGRTPRIWRGARAASLGLRVLIEGHVAKVEKQVRVHRVMVLLCTRAIKVYGRESGDSGHGLV